MLEYYSQRPYLVVILVAMAAFAVWACIKAAKASGRNHRENEAIMKKLDEDNRLKNEFAILTENLIMSAEAERLVRGVGMNLFTRLEAAEDISAAFDSLSQPEKDIYSLYFALDESSEKLSGFFRANGSPLTDTAEKIFSALYPGEISEVFSAQFRAYDEGDETTSFIASEIEQRDEKFASLRESSDIWSPAAQYIRDNVSYFAKI